MKTSEIDHKHLFWNCFEFPKHAGGSVPESDARFAFITTGFVTVTRFESSATALRFDPKSVRASTCQKDQRKT